jgi:MFS transporter, DHA1 family, multidrug resistance protein
MDKIDTKIFVTLFFAMFATVTGVGIVVPLLPVYAKTLGAGGFFIGMIFGGFSLTRSFFLPVFGRLSDTHGRKPFLVAGLFFYFLISLLFILAHHVYSLIIVRLIQGVASAMIMPVAQAYVGEITPRGKEGLTMGIFNMSIFIGLSIGPLLGGVIQDHFGLNVAFGSMAGLALVAFFLSFTLLPAAATEKIAGFGRPPVKWRLILQDPVIVSMVLFRFSYTACIGVVWGFLPVYGSVEFLLSSSAIGLLIMLGVSVSGLMHIPMGILSDRWNKKKMVMTGGAVVVVSMIMMGNAGGFYDLFAASMVFGIGGGISMPAIMALAVVRGNMSKAMGTVMALITVGHSMGMLVGSLFAGIIMDLAGLEMAFFLGGAIMAGGVAQFYLGSRDRVDGQEPAR